MKTLRKAQPLTAAERLARVAQARHAALNVNRPRYKKLRTNIAKLRKEAARAGRQERTLP